MSHYDINGFPVEIKIPTKREAQHRQTDTQHGVLTFALWSQALQLTQRRLHLNGRDKSTNCLTWLTAAPLVSSTLGPQGRK